MRIGICSFSFHRLLAAGKQDIFQFITDCKELGCTQLDPWNAHLADFQEGERERQAETDHDPTKLNLRASENETIERIKAAADEAGLPFGCIAVDGAHVYEEDPATRDSNRRLAHRWLDIASRLGARQVRIDAGGPEEMPDDVFKIITEGYRDLVSRGRDLGLQILFENHWGPTVLPDNVIRLVESVDGPGFLFDTNNWKEGFEEEGWERCAPYADCVHIKTFSFDEKGNDPSVNLAKAIGLLKEAGYDGCWGVESVPDDGDEYEAARKTIALIRREVGA